MFPFDEYIHPYDLCNDTVTVYHFDGGSVTRTVHSNAFFDSKKNQNIERTGGTETNGFLLVIPGDSQACHVGDKVILGEGPLVPGESPTGATGATGADGGSGTSGAASWWRAFIPSKVENLVVVKHVDVKRYGGVTVHTEAGG